MVDKRWVHQGFVAAALVAVFCAICIPFFVGQTDHEGNTKRGYRGLLDVNPDDDKAVHLEIMIANMNTQDYAIKAFSKVMQVPDSLYNTTANSLINPVRIQLGNANGVLTRTSMTIDLPLSTQLNLAEGSIAWYPFDSYEAQLDVLAATGAGAFTGATGAGIPMSVWVYQPEDFDWKYSVTKDASGQATDLTTASLAISVRRTFNMYILLVFVGIWIVTFAIGYIGCMAVIWKRRAPDNPIIFIAALFAVPAFRNTCPGSPPYGVLFDVLSTFFAIGVICTFLVLVSVAYMKKDKPATA